MLILNSKRLLIILAAVHSLVIGCGGMNQDDMRKYAIKRPKEDESKPARPAPPADGVTPSAGTDNATNASAQAGPAANNPSGTPAPVTAPPAAGVAGPAPGNSAPGNGAAASVTDAPTALGQGISDTRPPNPSLTPRDRRAMTIDNLKRITTAIEAYRAENGAYPPFAMHSTAGRPLLSWRVAILPHLGYGELYARFKSDEPWDSPNNHALLSQIPAVFQSPERFDTHTNYLVPLGTTTAFREGPRGQHPRRWEDGLENIVICVEADDTAAVPWTAPMDLAFATQTPRTSLGGLREDGFFAGWGGGAVLRVPAEVKDDQLRAMFSVDGGEAFSALAVCKMAMPDVTNTSMARPGAAIATAAPLPSAVAPANPARAATGGAAPQAFAGTASVSRAGFAPGPGSFNQTSLAHASAQAYLAGYRAEAVRYACAAFLIDEPEQAVAYQWVPGLRRPVTSIRYGIGLDYAGPQAENIRRQFADLSDDREFRGGRVQSVIGELADPLLARLHATPPVVPPPCQHPTPTPGRPTTNEVPLSFVGVGKSATLLRAAQRQDIDVLLMFDVEERTTRGGNKSKTVQFSVVDAWTGRELLSKQSVNYLKRQNSRTDPLYQDPIDQAAEAFSKTLAEELAPQPIPTELRAEHAQRRLEMLARMRRDNPLPVLSEMKLYRELDLVSVQSLMQAYSAVLESEKAGTELLAGTMDEKRSAIKRWIPNLEAELAQAAARRATRDDDDD